MKTATASAGERRGRKYRHDVSRHFLLSPEAEPVDEQE
jgi:hypothetical protein